MSLSRALVVLFSTLLLCSCSTEPPPASPNPTDPSPGGGASVVAPADDAVIDPAPLELDPELELPPPPPDPELREFLQRAEFFLRRFVEHAPTVSELELALEQGEDAVLRVLGLDTDEGRRRYREMQRHAFRLSERRPEIRQRVDALLRVGLPPCESWELLGMAGRLQAAGESRTREAKETRVVCEWVPYAAALVACTITGNTLLYFACAAIALCNHCTGGIVSTLCGG